MNASSMLFSAACAVALAGASACSGNDTTAGAGATDLPSCAGATASILKIEGDLDGSPVNVAQSPAGGGFSQFGTGQFDTPLTVTINGMPVATDPGVTSVHLTWPQTINDGSSGPASGTLVPPSGQPHAGQTVCAGAGTEVVMVSGGDFMQFDLHGLALGTACDQPLSGRLKGCWSSALH